MTSTSTPSLPELLNQILTTQLDFSKRLDRLLIQARHTSEQVTTVQSTLAKRRLPAIARGTDTAEALAIEAQARLDAYFDQLFRPMRLHDLTRIYSKRMSLLGLNGPALLKLMPNVFTINARTGGMLILPLSEWEQLPYPRQLEWTGAAPKDFETQRQRGIKAIQKSYDSSPRHEGLPPRIAAQVEEQEAKEARAKSIADQSPTTDESPFNTPDPFAIDSAGPTA